MDPVLQVVHVEPDRFVPGQVGSAGHLPETGDAGFDEHPPAVVPVAVDLAAQRGSGPDQAHVAEDDVEQLRQFVQAEPPEEPAERGDPRIVLQLEQHHIPGVPLLILQLVQAGLLVHHLDRNLIIRKTSPFRPTRSCRKNAGPGRRV